MRIRSPLSLLLAVALLACNGELQSTDEMAMDASIDDASDGSMDAASDASMEDASAPDGTADTSVDDAAEDAGEPDAPTGDAGDGGDDDASVGEDISASGSVSGAWCGNVTVTDDISVESGDILSICAGTIIAFPMGTQMEIEGEVSIEGEAGSLVRFEGDGWLGLRVRGSLYGGFAEIRGANLAIEGAAGSDIGLSDLLIEDAMQTLDLRGGGQFDRARFIGGQSARLRGGVVRMTDSVIDLGHDTEAPDCTKIDSTTVVLDHVRFTGCHCPIHFNSGGDAPSSITHSILDGATYPVMVANAVVSFEQNHFAGTSADILDIGGGIEATLSGNYFEGDEAEISSSDMSQFTGASDFSATPIDDVGPR